MAQPHPDQGEGRGIAHPHPSMGLRGGVMTWPHLMHRAQGLRIWQQERVAVFIATTPLQSNCPTYSDPGVLDTYGSVGCIWSEGCIWPVGWRLRNLGQPKKKCLTIYDFFSCSTCPNQDIYINRNIDIDIYLYQYIDIDILISIYRDLSISLSLFLSRYIYIYLYIEREMYIYIQIDINWLL